MTFLRGGSIVFRFYKFIFIMVVCFCSQAFSEWIDVTSYYGNETIYRELKKNWPAMGLTVKPNKDGKGEYKYIFDGKLQIFPCGPLKTWLVAYRGSKELCVYHFINNDGSNVKQTSGNSSFSAPKKSRKSKKGPRYPIEKGVDSLLPPYGIERFDLIVGVNGKLFEQPQSTNNEGGEYGPIYDLAMAIEKGQSSGRVSLLIKKPGSKPDVKPRSVNVKIEKLPPFSKTYPIRCRRSAMIENEIMEILRKDSEKPRLSNNISWGMVGLAMLASGQKKYLPAIEEYAMHLNDHFTRGSSDPNLIVTTHQGSAWKSGFTLVFLCEYFWATGDMRVFPTIQRLAYDADEYHMNAVGGAGHGAYGKGTYWDMNFGPPSGLNALGAGLAERIGAKVNQEVYEKYWNIMTQTTQTNIKNGNNDYKFVVKDDKDYYTCYGHITFERDLQKSLGPLQSINTATGALALMFNRYKYPEVKRLAQKLHDNLIYTYKIHSYIHTTPTMGHFFSQVALNANINSRPLNSRVIQTFNEPYANRYAGEPVKGSDQLGKVKELTSLGAWRKIMDYRKYLLIHSRLDKDTYFYFIPRLQNYGCWGGDGYANLRGSALYNLLGLVTSDSRSLLMYGGKVRNWLVAKSSKEASTLAKSTAGNVKSYHDTYSQYLVKYANYIYNGGNEKGKLNIKSKNDRERIKHYKLMAYETTEKVMRNYKGYSGYRPATALMNKITKELGGKKRVELYRRNLKAMTIIDYACALHERVNTKNWMKSRKNILKWIQSTYKDCPAAKVAAEEYKKTLELEAQLNQYEDLKLDKSSPLYTERKVPYIDVSQLGN